MITLCDKNNCTGCTACISACKKNAISMHYDWEGFKYPSIDYSFCVSCGACLKACPVIPPVEYPPHKHTVYSAFAKNIETRQSGSSGGLFTVLAEYILKEGGNVIGAAFQDLSYVKHIVVKDHSQLSRLQGSKYVQSDMGVTFVEVKKLLNNNIKILFSGTPCQVAGLKNYLRKSYENLYTIDVVCHGVPSPKLFAKYINFLKERYPNICSFSFRDLKHWSCNSIIYHQDSKNGKIYNKILYGIDMSYFALFNGGYVSRECCYTCPYAQSEHRVGDITLADFWGIGKQSSYSHDTSNGVSFVQTNTDKGDAMINEIKDNIIYELRNLDETTKFGGNTQLVHPANRPVERQNIYEHAWIENWSSFVSRYDLILKKRPNIAERIKNKIKQLLYESCILPEK